MATFEGQSEDGSAGFGFNPSQEPIDVFKIQHLITQARICLGMLKGELLFDPVQFGAHFSSNIDCEISHVRSFLADSTHVIHREKNFLALFEQFEIALIPMIAVSRNNRWRKIKPELLSNSEQLLQQAIDAGLLYVECRGFEQESLVEYARATDWMYGSSAPYAPKRPN